MDVRIRMLVLLIVLLSGAFCGLLDRGDAAELKVTVVKGIELAPAGAPVPAQARADRARMESCEWARMAGERGRGACRAAGSVRGGAQPGHQRVEVRLAAAELPQQGARRGRVEQRRRAGGAAGYV